MSIACTGRKENLFGPAGNDSCAEHGQCPSQGDLCKRARSSKEAISYLLCVKATCPVWEYVEPIRLLGRPVRKAGAGAGCTHGSRSLSLNAYCRWLGSNSLQCSVMGLLHYSIRDPVRDVFLSCPEGPSRIGVTDKAIGKFSLLKVLVPLRLPFRSFPSTRIRSHERRRGAADTDL